ncbi:MAG: hypothetical protein R3E32_28710 [Chitinophagales bacterium]
MNKRGTENYYLRAAIKKALQYKSACEHVQKALELGMYLVESEMERMYN